MRIRITALAGLLMLAGCAQNPPDRRAVSGKVTILAGATETTPGRARFKGNLYAFSKGGNHIVKFTPQEPGGQTLCTNKRSGISWDILEAGYRYDVVLAPC